MLYFSQKNITSGVVITNSSQVVKNIYKSVLSGGGGGASGLAGAPFILTGFTGGGGGGNFAASFLITGALNFTASILGGAGISGLSGSDRKSVV